jgi:hypothetical protein
MSMLLTLLFTCLAFFGLCEFGLSVHSSCFLPRTLVQSLPWSLSYLFRNLLNIWCYSFVGSITKSHQARYKTPNTRPYIISTSDQLCEILYTDSRDELVLWTIVASHYYNCCTDGSTSPGNCGYSLLYTIILLLSAVGLTAQPLELHCHLGWAVNLCLLENFCLLPLPISSTLLSWYSCSFSGYCLAPKNSSFYCELMLLFLCNVFSVTLQITSY